MSEQIRVLSNREQARERINVFHGSSNNWINMIKELIGNSKDIFKKNMSTDNKIEIIIHNNNKIEYIDNATGIPVEGVASDGSPNYVAIFEKPFAGSNYSNEFDTVGQNGIFLWSLSMTCENIEYFIARPNKNIYNITYEKGELKKKLSIIGKSDKTYTKMIFELDQDIWEKPNFTFEEISEIAKNQASIGNLTISIKDIINNKNITYYYENGLIDYFKEITSNKSKVTENIIINSSKKSNIVIKGKEVEELFSTNIIFNYSNDNLDDIKKEFLNTADLTQYGTIQEGMITGLKNSINKWLRNNNKYQKNEKQITNDDVFVGLNYVSNNTSLYVEYENQTKVKTSTDRYKDIMKSIIEEYMEIFFIENNLQTEGLCNQILINKRAREKSDQTRLDIKKKLQSENTIRDKIPNLIDCKSKNKNENILCICEGKSALSAMISGRQDIHALFPIRGKILNCLKAPIEKIINSDVVVNLIKALGCGIEIKNKSKNLSMFDIERLNYSKIYIYVDADFDGIGSILPLLLTVFWKLTPTLVKQGRIYICETPKYEISVDDKYLYATDDDELQVVLNNMNNKKYKIHYIKGLSELSSEAMAMCLNPTYKNITQITVDDIEKSIQMLELFMSDDIKPRKEYILNEFYKEEE